MGVHVSWHDFEKYYGDVVIGSLVKNILKRAITLIATTILTIGLIGACTP